MSNLNYSLDFELSENDYLSNLFGVDDKNIQIIEKIHNVEIKYRGNKIKVIGTKKSIKDTKDEILLLFEEAKKGVNIDEDKIMLGIPTYGRAWDVTVAPEWYRDYKRVAALNYERILELSDIYNPMPILSPNIPLNI